MTNINCKSFEPPHFCLHPAAPKRLLGNPYCILVIKPDDRCSGCKLQNNYTRPIPPGAE